MKPPSDHSVANVSEADWENTPIPVKRLVLNLLERVERLEQQVQELREENQQLRTENEQLKLENQQLKLENQQLREENGQLRLENQQLREQLGRNSQNSSQPPSQDAPRKFTPKAKKKSDKRRGGQPGHPGHERKLYPPQQCQSIEQHYPSHCINCGQSLSGEDPQPVRIQIVEIPPLVPIVREHRFHARVCTCCGQGTRAFDEAIVNGSGSGERLSALVALLSSEYRQSHAMVQRLLLEVFDVELSIGSINQLRQEISEAVAQTVKQAHQYVQQQPTLGSDETSFTQGNGDAQNPTKKQGWLWVLVTPLVCYFQVYLSRAQTAAQQLIGTSFTGRVISDRYGAYNWLDIQQRQLCWAHLKRDFTKIAQRDDGASAAVGEALLEQQKELFVQWYQVRDGTLSREAFIQRVEPIRFAVKSLLEEGATYEFTPKDKSSRAKTARTCQQLLKVEPALWLFVTTPGVEPTNNDAERALRSAVIWRKSSYGSQSAAGSQFVSRMLTVVTTLRLQQRPALEFLTQACRAKRLNQPPPSLLPTQTNTNQVLTPAA
jgi:regulator of replication initiation timing